MSLDGAAAEINKRMPHAERVQELLNRWLIEHAPRLLASASTGRINATIEELQKADIKAVMPCHCTGKKAITKFSKVFGKKCNQLRTGNVVIF